jgi:maltose 6'-phosphate phosphatase
MNEIQLLTVENTLVRKGGTVRQALAFLVSVENLGFVKAVDVVWAGEDGAWQEMPAQYRGPHGATRECWAAGFSVTGQPSHPVPGSIRFALRFRCGQAEFWDNNRGNDYQSSAGSGAMLGNSLGLRNLDLNPILHEKQQIMPVRVAVSPELHATRVLIHWSTDHWQEVRQTPCRRARQGKAPSAQVWSARLPVGDAYRVAYRICAEGGRPPAWDNNAGSDYQASRRPFKVLVLNLHCYQEEEQDRKFSLIAKGIDEAGVDVVCFQEVAENWNAGHGDWASNSARIINERLRRPMDLCVDWSHLGFERYREGVAILSRYPLRRHHGCYVSDSHDVHSIHSRKVLMAQVPVPYMGLVNVFSAHLSWMEDGFQAQFRRLAEWAAEEAAASGGTTLLCGDFNVPAGSDGYRYVVDGRHYEDQFLAANAPEVSAGIFRVDDPHWRDYPGEDSRIDYIFMRKGGALRVTSARTLFTEHDYGRVSDHCGYLMTFELR